MRIIRSSLIMVMLFVTAAWSIPSIDEVLVLVEEMNTSFINSTSYEIRVQVQLLKNGEHDPIRSFAAVSAKTGNKYFSNMNGVLVIQNDELTISCNEYGKTISVKRKDEVQDEFVPDQALAMEKLKESLIAGKDRLSVIDNNENAITVSLAEDAMGQYARTELTIDKRRKVPLKVVYHLDQAADLKYDRVEMTYTRFDLSGRVAPALFDVNRYVVNGTDGVFRAHPDYSDHRIIDLDQP